MDLQAELLALKTKGSKLPIAEQAELACLLSRQFEKAGDYEAARKALEDFWPSESDVTKFSLLEEITQATLKLRAGSLLGRKGFADQAASSQETASNLITESIETFRKCGNTEGLAEASSELAMCYWRQGSFDEARIHLAEALRQLRDERSDLKATLLIRAAVVEVDAEQFDEALRFYNEALTLVEKTKDHDLKGSFHNGYGVLLRRLATPENRESYLDRALIEYAAASYHYEEAGNQRAVARVEGNLGYLHFTIGRYKDAHAHLDRARHIFLQLKDVGTAAQVDETRARTLLAQGHITEAERIVRAAVRVLERGGQQAILAEAIATQGVALARMGNDTRARALFERAIETAQTAGDLEGAGRVKLNIIEELGEKIPAKELVTIYRSAIQLLSNSQDPSTTRRLIACAEILFEALERYETEELSPESSWEGFSLKQHAKASERTVIERALRDAGGSVSKAAKLLGFKHHQSLISLLNGRHKELVPMRSVARKRRKHIVAQPKPSRKPRRRDRSVRAQISILHVEDSPIIARAVRDIVEAEGWRIELCTSGDTALRKLTGNEHYDALVFANSLPGINGLELIERAHKITHRRRTPIIVLSRGDCEKAAWRAGANAFLAKPHAGEQLVPTLRRLFKEFDRGGDIVHPPQH